MNAETLLCTVIARLRSGFMDEIAREHAAGQLEEVRATIRECVPRILSPDVREALVGWRGTGPREPE